MSAKRRSNLLVAAVAIFALLVMAQPFRFDDPAYFYFDDFFYYLVPARHFVETGRFFVHPAMTTNGFQPLWMAVVVAITFATHGHGAALFVFLNVVIAGLLAWSSHQAMALVREAGGGAALQIAGCLVVLAMQLEIATTGMEVALTTPLLLWLTRCVIGKPLADRSSRELALVGLLGALVVLSRLDSAILLAPVAVVLALRDRPRPRALASIAAGALPLWIYFVADRALAGSFLPISGTAKMLKGISAPTLAPLEPIALELGRYALVSPIGFVVLAVVALLARSDDARARERAIVVSAAAGVIAYYATYSVMTDWRLWFWYKYPLAWLGVLACAKLAWSKSVLATRASLVLSAVLAIVAVRVMVPRTPSTNWIYAHAHAVAAFEASHPGSYAMGDCAGGAAYLLDVPILQTEGLVGDRAYLDLVRAGTPLHEALHRHGVDYYAAVGARREGDCYLLREPSMAGPASPVMLGRACTAPLLHRDAVLPLDIFRTEDIH